MFHQILTWYAAALLACVLLSRVGMERPLLVAMLPLIAIDCAGNLLLLQSWRKTLSGEAWHHREHHYWWWCCHAIDVLFFWQQDHCKVQAERELRFGSVWAAWLATWKEEA